MLTLSYGGTSVGAGNIGGYTKVGPANVAMTGNVTKTLQSISLTAGVWLLTASLTTASNGSRYNAMSFSFVNNSLNLQLGATNISAINGFTYNLSTSFVFPLDATTNIYQVSVIENTATLGDIIMTVTRIA